MNQTESRLRSILYLMYPTASITIFSAFICDELEDGTPMLRADYSFTCWKDEHWGVVFYAIAMMFVYPFGTPLLCISTASN